MCRGFTTEGPAGIGLDMRPSEKVTLGMAIEVLEEKAAAARMKAGKKIPSGNLPEGKGETREKVGKAVGMSGTLASSPEGESPHRPTDRDESRRSAR